MPVLTKIEILELIKQEKISAITLDTTVFYKYGHNLNYTLLLSLEQFKGSTISVVFSEIVLRELAKQITKNAEEALVNFKAAFRKQHKVWKSEVVQDTLLNEITRSKSASDMAAEQITEYLDHVGAIKIDAASKVEVAAEVIDRYFSCLPPFEKKEAKKSEFPDAFALLSLEASFSSKCSMILCVSADGGWQDFAEQSDWIVCIDSLDKALSYFNETGRPAVDKAMELLTEGRAPDLKAEIETAIQSRIEDADFDAECDTPLDYEAEPISASLISILEDTISNIEIIEANEEKISFSFTINALSYFEATFNFRSYDGYDGDYVSLSSEYADTKQKIELKIIVTITNESLNEPIVLKSEAFIRELYDINFGYVEPFPNEDPTHEKY